jgi:hypothetical protein
VLRPAFLPLSHALRGPQDSDEPRRPSGRTGAAPSELNAQISLEDWNGDPSMRFFRCRRIVRSEPRTLARPRLLPRLLAITSGYIIALEPTERELRDWPEGDELPASAPSSAPATPQKAVVADDPLADAPADPLAGKIRGSAFLKSKHRLNELEKITSKKSMPNVLTFHWRSQHQSGAQAAQPQVQFYLVDRCRECIQLVRERFTAFVHAQQAAEEAAAAEAAAAEAAGAGPSLADAAVSAVSALGAPTAAPVSAKVAAAATPTKAVATAAAPATATPAKDADQAKGSWKPVEGTPSRADATKQAATMEAAAPAAAAEVRTAAMEAPAPSAGPASASPAKPVTAEETPSKKGGWKPVESAPSPAAPAAAAAAATEPVSTAAVEPSPAKAAPTAANGSSRGGASKPATRGGQPARGRGRGRGGK